MFMRVMPFDMAEYEACMWYMTWMPKQLRFKDRGTRTIRRLLRGMRWSRKSNCDETKLGLRRKIVCYSGCVLDISDCVQLQLPAVR